MTNADKESTDIIQVNKANDKCKVSTGIIQVNKVNDKCSEKKVLTSYKGLRLMSNAE